MGKYTPFMWVVSTTKLFGMHIEPISTTFRAIRGLSSNPNVIL
jgi:hypothetical protein